jgi:hypothetical protein
MICCILIYSLFLCSVLSWQQFTGLASVYVPHTLATPTKCCIYKTHTYLVLSQCNGMLRYNIVNSQIHTKGWICKVCFLFYASYDFIWLVINSSSTGLLYDRWKSFMCTVPFNNIGGVIQYVRGWTACKLNKQNIVYIFQVQMVFSQWCSRVIFPVQGPDCSCCFNGDIPL